MDQLETAGGDQPEPFKSKPRYISKRDFIRKSDKTWAKVLKDPNRFTYVTDEDGERIAVIFSTEGLEDLGGDTVGGSNGS